MQFQPQFFRCAHCGQIVSILRDAGVPIVCCGQRMDRLVPNATDAAQEKHVPVVAREGDMLTVRVGSAAHPMLAEHSIEWVYLHMAGGGQRRILSPGEAPEAVFCVGRGQALEAYAYCNLHGLWKAAV